MKKFFLTISFILIYSLSVSAQQDSIKINVSNLEIRGNNVFSKREIRDMVPPGECSDKQFQQSMEELLKNYQKKGYYFARLRVRDSLNKTMIDVDENGKFILNRIELACQDSTILPALWELLDVRKKEQISHTINANAEKFLVYLENHGYPFGKVTIDSLIKSTMSEANIGLNCYLKVDPGAFVTVDSIHVLGNEITQEHVVIRETRLQTGAYFDFHQVAQIKDRLMKTGYFESVKDPYIMLDKQGHGHLFIPVKEGNPNQFNAVFGYNPGTAQNEKGYITGLIDVAFRNLLGTGRIAEAFWQKKDRRSQELRFRYVEPWVKGWPVNVGFGFQQMIQDTSFVRRSWGFDVDVPYSPNLTIHSRVGKESVLPDSIGQVLYQLPKSSSRLAKIGFSYDTRNNLRNPSRGVFYRTYYEYANKKIVSLPNTDNSIDLEKGTFRRDRWSVDAEVYLPTFQWQTILLGLHGRQVKSSERKISIADLYRLGGLNSLRGYREEEFLGERLAWMNLEYRYLLGTNSRIFLFTDAGYVSSKDEDQKLVEKYKFSYGFGIRIETRLGVIAVDYGLAEGRGLTSGLVHIGLTNKF